MSTRLPEAAPPPALCAIAKSSNSLATSTRTRSLPQPSSCRTRELFERRMRAFLQSLARGRAQLIHRIEYPAAFARDLFVTRPGNFQFIFFRPARRMNQVRMRIDKPRQRPRARPARASPPRVPPSALDLRARSTAAIKPSRTSSAPSSITPKFGKGIAPSRTASAASGVAMHR